MRTSHLADTAVAIFIFAVAAVGGSVSGAWGQAAPATGGATTAPTLQAELVKTIDVAHVRAGDEVTARTDIPLVFDGATFPVGSMVLGHVTVAEPSRLSLVFDHIVVKKNAQTPIGLSLRAVMMPHSSPQSAGEQMSPRAEGGGGNTGVDQAIQTPRGRGDMLRSPEAAAQDSANTVFRGPRSVDTGSGGVIGMSGVHLQVSSDPKAAAVFQSDKDNKLKLEKGLLVIFVVSK